MHISFLSFSVSFFDFYSLSLSITWFLPSFLSFLPLSFLLSLSNTWFLCPFILFLASNWSRFLFYYFYLLFLHKIFSLHFFSPFYSLCPSTGFSLFILFILCNLILSPTTGFFFLCPYSLSPKSCCSFL